MVVRTKDHNRGFTLVEFLTTIAIIFVLAGLIFAASVAVIRSGKSSSCLNNLKQMHLALLLYAESNNDVIPPVGLQTSLQPDDPIVQSSNRRFAELIKNYHVSKDQLFVPLTNTRAQKSSREVVLSIGESVATLNRKRLGFLIGFQPECSTTFGHRGNST